MKTKVILATITSVILLLQIITFNTALASKAISIPDQYNKPPSMQSIPYPNVELKWTPDKPTAGQEVTFTVSFKKPDKGSLQPDIDYKFVIVKDGTNLFTVTKHTNTGSDKIKQKLDTQGNYIITVTITGIDFKPVDPKSSDFSLVVVKAQTQQQAPSVQQQKQQQNQTQQTQPKTMPKVEESKKMVPKMKEEGKKPMRATLIDEKGKRLGMVRALQSGPNTIIHVSLRAVGLAGHISAWLVAGPNENVTENNWNKVGKMSAIQIGHSETAKRINLFNQRLSFVPASGDMIVIVIDDCSSGDCKPTMNRVATAALK